MYLFWFITVEIGHSQQDTLKDYWSTLEQSMTFYENTIKLDRFFHMLRFMHFSDNKNKPDKTQKLRGCEK
jgi:hypothetical protein